MVFLGFVILIVIDYSLGSKLWNTIMIASTITRLMKRIYNISVFVTL